MGTLKLAVRASSYDARYSYGAKHVKLNPTLLTQAVDAGALSGYTIQMTSTTQNMGIKYSGYTNCLPNRSFSSLIRIKNNYTGTPAANRVLFQLGYGAGNTGPNFQVWHATTTGQVTIYCANEANTVCLNSVTFGVWAPTAGTYYDIFVKWDGTTTANAVKVYIDGTLLGQATAGAALTSSWLSEYFDPILIGTGNAVSRRDFYLDEFVLWDGDVDPTSVALVGGTGSLNGAARTNLVDAAAFDGSTYTDPGAAQVKTGTGYTFAGAANTGTYDGSDRWTDPTEAAVQTGVAYKANSTTNNKTGTYTGADRWTDPGESNVLLATAYKANSTTNNKTGQLEVPVAATVLTGITYGVAGAQTGTLSVIPPSITVLAIGS